MLSIGDVFNEDEIISITSDYVPKIGEYVFLDDSCYEILSKKVEIVDNDTIITIRVSKKRPPVDGVTQWSRVTLFH